MSNWQEEQYLDLIANIMGNGVYKQDRTGTGTYSVFGCQMNFDIEDTFPLMTTKKVNFDAIIKELLWFISGSTNIRPLLQQGVHIWSDWPYKRFRQYREGQTHIKELTKQQFEQLIVDDPEFARYWGDLGPVYGKQWRNAAGVDQLGQAIELLKHDPDSRRIIVDSWNPPELTSMALTPCHCLFQFYSRLVEGERYLDCHLYQRSADMFLGVPFNIASYALLTHLIASVTDHVPGEFIWTGGDCHVYSNHTDQVDTQLERDPVQFPQLVIDPRPTIEQYTPHDIRLVGYDPAPAIKAPIAV